MLQGVGMIEGVVTIVQESRFQVMDDAGAGHLIVLGAHAGAEPSQLEALARGQNRVRVWVKPASGAMGFVARRVEVL